MTTQYSITQTEYWNLLSCFLEHQALLLRMFPSSGWQELFLRNDRFDEALILPYGGRPIGSLHTEMLEKTEKKKTINNFALTLPISEYLYLLC